MTNQTGTKSAPRASLPGLDITLLQAHIELSPGWERVKSLSDGFGQASSETLEQVLGESYKFARQHLEPLNESMDAHGARIENGRVLSAPGHQAAWDAFREGQWLSVSAPEDMGGFGMPTAVWSAVQSICDRANPAFGMTAVPQISAAKLIARFGTEALKAEWLPKLITSEWGATICISESDAGSDVRRMKTRAVDTGNGYWEIEGEKNWISFGDHDLTPRIGHCLVAKTKTEQGEGLSLFFVPNVREENGELVDNYVRVRRIEEKLGLHGSPTCALGFEKSKGILLGEPGRGLQQMFVMITNMRIAVGAMGLGIATSARDTAFAYAAERRQGGRGPQPVPINEHADVQRMLMDMGARTEMLRALIMTLANYADIAAHIEDADEKRELMGLTAWLLPIVKTLGAEISFETAHEAVQVLGGAGYTKDWPVEQALRDARVLSVFEGTTGIQALDLVERNLRRKGRAALTGFENEFKTALEPLNGKVGPEDLLQSFLKVSEDICAMDSGQAQTVATSYLRLTGEMALLWMALHLSAIAPDTPAGKRLKAYADYWIEACAPIIAGHMSGCTLAKNILNKFDIVNPF